MTIAALTQRLLRYWRVDDVASLAADDALALVDAINGGLQESYALLPPRLLQKRFVAGFDAPQNITVGVTNASTAVTMPNGFTDTAGRLRIAGDAILHELAGAGTLAAPYDGPTGNQPAVFYHDTLTLSLDVARMLSGPTVLENGEALTMGYPMVHERDALGTPSHYYLTTQPPDAESPMHFTVWPMPDARYRVEWIAEVRPPKVTLRQLAAAVAVPFNDRLIESGLLPLIAARLVFSPRWADPAQRAGILDAAENARTLLLRSMNDNVSSTHNTVGTPEGF
jgi:hypothetical protein